MTPIDMPRDPAAAQAMSDAIDRATPDWVRRCRAMHHTVTLQTVIHQPDGALRCDWQCRDCGKDRR